MPNANDACDADSSKNVDFLDEFLPFFFTLLRLFLGSCSSADARVHKGLLSFFLFLAVLM